MKQVMLDIKRMLVKPQYKTYYYDANKENKCDNVFYISHLGQLRQVETLIEFEKLSNNLLIIGYTNKNLEMPSFVLEQADKNKFENIICVEIMASPNYLTPGKIKQIKYIYKRLCEGITAKELYLLSIEGHYAIFAKYMKDKGVSINLMEEGTATYKFERKNNQIYINSPVVRMGLHTKIVCKLFGIDKDLLVENFNKIYVAFPEKLKNVFEANEYILFFAHINLNVGESINKIIEEYAITSQDIIFVSQRFDIDFDIFAARILDILEIYAASFKTRVFIKHHPKETPNQISSFRKEIIKRKLGDKIISISDKAFLVENILFAVGTRMLVGLTSTSLVYCPIINKNTMVYSIAPMFLRSLGFLDEAQKQMLSTHLSELQRTFVGIRMVSSAKDIVESNINSNELEIDESNVAIEMADRSFVEGKFLKAVFYYGQITTNIDFLCKPDILYNMLYCWSMLENDFKEYDLIIKIMQLNIVFDEEKSKLIYKELMRLLDNFLRNGNFERIEKLEKLSLKYKGMSLHLDLKAIKLKKMLYLEDWNGALELYSHLGENNKRKYHTAIKIVQICLKNSGKGVNINIEEIECIEDVAVKECVFLAYLYYCGEYDAIRDYIAGIESSNAYLFQKYNRRILLQEKYQELIEQIQNNKSKKRMILDELPYGNVKDILGNLIECLENDRLKKCAQDIERLVGGGGGIIVVLLELLRFYSRNK
ncbi:alpha-2,8-polysialyltransferase family protein [Helicobacter rodentium]|uniref:alpha-2,8-polysialyltransferase family protein n=1 Tax=Helicobacter rodentium TaxID=59617 RepID=UPI000690FE3F|nr:alpha-2,8-polysialyltransferase family protein [Helicobacter rodentium]